MDPQTDNPSPVPTSPTSPISLGNPTSSSATTVPTIHPLLRSFILAYGGVAVIQWLHTALAGADAAQEGGDYSHWLRDATLALPLVIAAVVLGAKRLSGRGGQAAPSAGTATAALFAAVMGAGSLMHSLFPADAHAAHEGGDVSNLAVIQGVLVVMVIAFVYALVIDMLLGAVSGTPAPVATPFRFGRISFSRHYSRVALPIAAALALAPALAFTGGGRAVAQTTLPDQVIHPRGNLLLIARNVSDGMAFVAPDFGNNGVRPTIEMTEGETLNITVKNELNADISLHVHGVHYNQDSDGTRHSNSFVRPGQTRVYQWRAAVGTAGYWHYHDHVMGDDEGTGGILGGLYGALIVRKPGDPRPVKTFVIVGQDKTLNGRIYPDTPTYTARQGELVEWVVVSHGNRVHTFHLHAHRWLNPSRASDPNPAAPANVGSGWEDNHILAPGSSFGFLTIAGEDVGPGMWMYHCHFQDHASAMKGFFNVLPPASSAQVSTSQFFPETGKTVQGRFLEYWKQNGGLAQQGYPISEPFMEKSDLDGRTYLVQYFERAVFEAHPEKQRPYDVLLSQLGTFRYKEKYPANK